MASGDEGERHTKMWMEHRGRVKQPPCHGGRSSSGGDRAQEIRSIKRWRLRCMGEPSKKMSIMERLMTSLTMICRTWLNIHRTSIKEDHRTSVREVGLVIRISFSHSRKLAWGCPMSCQRTCELTISFGMFFTHISTSQSFSMPSMIVCWRWNTFRGKKIRG